MKATGFEPPWWLFCAHAQTIYGAVFAHAPPVIFRRERWDTRDGDFVDVDFVDGPAGSPWVHLYHGLEGSSNSHYARMLMAHVIARGWRGSVFHFRGCSGEPNRLARAYHCGDSEEIDWSIRLVKSLAGYAPLYAAGVSLGGNAFAKWLGERGDSARDVVARAAVVSAPVNLLASGDALSRGLGIFYSLTFLRTLKRTALAKLERFPGLFDAAAVRRAISLRAFDDAVTAPLHGFKNVDDYYTRSSAKQYLAGIRVETLLVNARDDPFLPGKELPSEGEVPPSVRLEFSDRGGHAGFVSSPFPGHIEWLPRRLLHFFEHGQ